MDKESIILKYEQLEVEDAENEITDLKNKNTEQEDNLKNIKNKVKELYDLKGITPKTTVDNKIEIKSKENDNEKSKVKQLSFDELYCKAEKSLIDRGLDVESLDYHALVTEEQLKEIIAELNRPLSKREKWQKADFVAVFVAASIGSAVDIILSNRQNKFTGKDSKFSKKLNKLHKHDSGDPIDYQGEGFGGGYHRCLSKGHDLTRFVESIQMFKDGKFEGIRYINKEAIKVTSYVNQYGNDYKELALIEAILKYLKHMVADLFSTYSLPFPGSSFLMESNNRELRKLAADMYKNGFNLKNILTQSLSVAVIEIIIRVYFGIKSVKKYKEQMEVAEDYSNFNAIKQFIKPNDKEKLNEMLLLAHTIVTGVNVGKVIIKKAPWEINIAEIMCVIKYGTRVLKGIIKRNNEYEKLIRNSNEIHERWNQLALELNIEKEEEQVLDKMEVLVI